MVEYSYSKIKIINDKGITFKDGTKIIFEECRCNWAKEKELDDTHCVAERNMSASKPYFIFPCHVFVRWHHPFEITINIC